MALIRDWYNKFPKVELHRHLEGAVRFDTLASIAKRHNLALPWQRWSELRKLVEITEPQKDLSKVIDMFQTIQKIFVAPEVLERIAFEAVEDAWNDGVRMLELRFAPSFITEGHELSYTDALDAIERGIKRAREKWDIGVGVILIIIRRQNEAQAEKVLELAKKFRSRIVGLDLADEEKNFDFASLEKIFTTAANLEIPVTIHAGEEPGCAQNVVEAISRYRARRIGHGVQVAKDADAREFVKAKEITLELCPTSNFLTQAVETIEQHPAIRLLRAGVNITINTDDPEMMRTNLSQEFRICGELLGCRKEEIRTLTMNAFNASFLDPDQKAYYEKNVFARS